MKGAGFCRNVMYWVAVPSPLTLAEILALQWLIVQSLYLQKMLLMLAAKI